MKTIKSRKIAALVLTLAMILPMISIPTVAADESGYTLYSFDFEGKHLDTDLDGDGVNDAYRMVGGEDSVKDFGEDYIVADPTNAVDHVWRVSTAALTNTQVTGIRPTYASVGTVFFENDVYIATGTSGVTRWRMYGTAAYEDGSGDERTWYVFYDLDLNYARITLPDGTTVSLKKDAWINLSYALELTSGDVTLYVNGDAVYTGALLRNGKAVEKIRMELFYNAMVDVRGVGALYVDNIRVFEGDAPTGALKQVSIFERDFDGMAFDRDLDGDGVADAYKLVDAESGFFYDNDEGLNTYIDGKGSTNSHYIMGDPTSNYTDNGAWRIPMGVDNYNNWGHILPAMTDAAYRYPRIVVEMDLYVPEGITSCWARWRSWAGRNPDGELGETYVFMDLDLSSAILHLGDGSYALGKEIWRTVSICIDFKSGEVEIYVDNVLALCHDLGDDLLIGYFWFAMPDDYGSADHYLWIDDINIFTGIQPSGGVLERAPLSPIYSNTMEGQVFDTDLDGDGKTDAHKLTDAEGIGYGGDRPNAVVDAYHEGLGTQASAEEYQYFVQDPTGAANDVWRIPMTLSNNDSWGHLIGGRDPFSVSKARKILLENDVYISKDAIGKVQWQIYAGAFKSLFNLNLHDASLYINTNHHSDVSIVGDMQLKQEQWYRLSYVMDLADGDWTLYVDQVAVAVGNVGLTDIAVTWLWNARLLEANGNFKGCLYVDDVKVYAADDLSSVYTEQSVAVDAEKTLQYVDVTVNGRTVRGAATKYLVAAGDAHEAHPVYFNENGEFDAVVTNVGKTSVRYGREGEENPAGLRFATEVDLALLDRLEQMVADGTLLEVTMGTRIAPTDYIQKVEGIDTEPIAETLAELIPGETVVDIPVKRGQWFDFSDAENYPGTYFVGSIVNLKVGNYARAFSAAGYVKVTLLSGESVYLLAETHSADVRSVSEGVLSVFGDRLSDYAKEVLQNYVDGISNGVPAEA